MNIRRSILVALAQRDLKANGLADKVGMSKSAMSRLMNSDSCTTETLKRLADALDMKVSELVALGEEKPNG